MKVLLVCFLALSSISAFAGECDVKVYTNIVSIYGGPNYALFPNIFAKTSKQTDAQDCLNVALVMKESTESTLAGQDFSKSTYHVFQHIKIKYSGADGKIDAKLKK